MITIAAPGAFLVSAPAPENPMRDLASNAPAEAVNNRADEPRPLAWSQRRCDNDERDGKKSVFHIKVPFYDENEGATPSPAAASLSRRTGTE